VRYILAIIAGYVAEIAAHSVGVTNLVAVAVIGMVVPLACLFVAREP